MQTANPPLKAAILLAALLASALALPTLARAEVPPPAPGVERSQLFALADGDRLEDTGIITVNGGPDPRTEAFEVVRRADGGRTLTSVIDGLDTSYRVEGRWTYGPDETLQAARGLGRYAADPVTVDIRVTRPSATITLERNDTRQTITAPCSPCLADLSPSALPMFSMTRRYDQARGGVQSFRWIGRSLIQDSLLTEGRVDLQRVRRDRVQRPDGTLVTVTQYHLAEYLKDVATGRVMRLVFNLYVDGDQRPLGFVIAKGTASMRAGFDDLPQQLEPVFELQPAAP